MVYDSSSMIIRSLDTRWRELGPSLSHPLQNFTPVTTEVDSVLRFLTTLNTELENTVPL